MKTSLCLSLALGIWLCFGLPAESATDSLLSSCSLFGRRQAARVAVKVSSQRHLTRALQTISEKNKYSTVRADHSLVNDETDRELEDRSRSAATQSVSRSISVWSKRRKTEYGTYTYMKFFKQFKTDGLQDVPPEEPPETDEEMNSGKKVELRSPRHLIFTPNNDGENDIVVISVSVSKDFFGDIEFKIFDLTGHEIFSDYRKNEDIRGKSIVSFEWDGDPPIIYAETGIYIYIVKAGQEIFPGTITLITDMKEVPEAVLSIKWSKAALPIKWGGLKKPTEEINGCER